MNGKRGRVGRSPSALPNAALLLDRAADVALHTQLYRQLRDAILTGRLAAGARLPSTRDLARELEVSRNTTLEAFTQLSSEGYLEGHVGSGTYVSRQLPDDLLQLRERPRPESRSAAPARARGPRSEISPISVAEYSGRPRPIPANVPALDAFTYSLWSRLLAARRMGS